MAAIIGGVYLDMVESDEPTHEYEVTDKAVEEGENVADHMKAQPAMLSITGVVVGPDAWPRLARIRQLQSNRELITYINRVVYSNMAIVSISTSHSGKVANGFNFTIQMKHVRVAAPKEIQITNVPPAVQTKASGTKNAGTKQAKDTGKSSSQSLAEKIRQQNQGTMTKLEKQLAKTQ